MFSGQKLEELSENLRKEFAENPPVAGSHVPKRGEIVAAKYTVDNQWYRAKVEKVEKSHVATVLFIDYGNVSTLRQTFHKINIF